MRSRARPTGLRRRSSVHRQRYSHPHPHPEVPQRSGGLEGGLQVSRASWMAPSRRLMPHLRMRGWVGETDRERFSAKRRVGSQDPAIL
ncbi:hypothetical protein FV234_00685 [Methylobacterium sp. WL8]|nr:hypothetical protein FV219_08625 [Methylobacterium sp. WL122]TXN85101.1 hypothetical protein FV234_00685 [Methylobacterium sp. WL8]